MEVALYSRKGSLEKRQLSLLVNFARNRPDLAAFRAGRAAEGNTLSFEFEASTLTNDL